MMAPHGTANGLLGLAALVQVSATLPANYIAFELPSARTPWWNEIVTGVDDLNVVDSYISVPNRPGMGVDFIIDKAVAYLEPEDQGFFDS